MKKHVAEQYIISALKYLEKEKTEKVSSSLKGKAASLGPTIISIGMLPAAVFYSDDEERQEVIRAIWAILCSDEKLRTDGCSSLSEYIMNGKDEAALKHDRILAASTAYKIALRTYPEKEEKK